MAKDSKRYTALRAKVDREKLYPISDALKVIKENATAKFNESIDVSINLGIDAKKSDQRSRLTEQQDAPPAHSVGERAEHRPRQGLASGVDRDEQRRDLRRGTERLCVHGEQGQHDAESQHIDQYDEENGKQRGALLRRVGSGRCSGRILLSSRA